MELPEGHPPSIKNQRVHDLARQAAAVTGTSQTAAIEEALTRLLADQDIDPEQQRGGEGGSGARHRPPYLDTPHIGDHEINRVEDLFDDRTGLPDDR